MLSQMIMIPTISSFHARVSSRKSLEGGRQGRMVTSRGSKYTDSRVVPAAGGHLQSTTTIYKENPPSASRHDVTLNAYM